MIRTANPTHRTTIRLCFRNLATCTQLKFWRLLNSDLGLVRDECVKHSRWCIMGKDNFINSQVFTLIDIDMMIWISSMTMVEHVLQYAMWNCKRIDDDCESNTKQMSIKLWILIWLSDPVYKWMPKVVHNFEHGSWDDIQLCFSNCNITEWWRHALWKKSGQICS